MSDTTVTPTPAPAPRRGGLLWPVVLIALGAVVLLGNLGYVPPVSWRALAALWPLVLVTVGIEMLVARRQPYLALALEILVIALGIGLSIAQPRGYFAPVSSGPSDATVAREGATALMLRVAGGAGDYRVSGGAAALVEAHSDNGQLSVRTNRSGSGAEVRVEPGEVTDIFRFGSPPQGVTVRVASDLPASVRVDGGAGDFTVDLRDVMTTDVRIDTGASQVHLTLPTPRGDVPVKISAGAASIEVVVPAGVEARITTRGGAISVRSDNARLTVNGGAAETAGYAAAKDRVTVDVQGGAASVAIR
ncbi:MAG: hypothetical protein HYX56_05195 [Chloroflexi bacterium]|nr:hypothetical protein [Chloroflexota bacterium]